ncbi:5-(carboxyamino)imidazole ribonucleotide synthase [bacterium]|nr:5-(carboxyamino)imidazole ribonucleotide synthase [bacterium]
MIVPYSFEPIGIIGGGQLGQMMAQSAMTLGIPVGVIDPDPNAPCSVVTSRFTVGRYDDFDSLISFGSDYSRITTEFEHINCNALDYLVSQGKRVAPNPDAVRLIQDKGLQKQFYARHGFPSPEFHLVENRRDINAYIDFLPAVLKLRKNGYDGKGVVSLFSQSDIENAFDLPSVLEKRISIHRELSVVAARDQFGTVLTYQPSELIAHPDAHLLQLLISPARLPATILTRAREIASDLINQLRIVGILAVEFFVTEDGRLLINEIAPRPHNSGHHTMDSAPFSQFDQHIRAVAGLPLGVIDTERPAAMVNLIGEPGNIGVPEIKSLAEWLQAPNVFIHWYGKSAVKPFRKMGHVTILSDTPDGAESIARRAMNELKVVAKVN